MGLPVDAIARGDAAGLGLVALIVAGVGPLGLRSLLLAFRLGGISGGRFRLCGIGGGGLRLGLGGRGGSGRGRGRGRGRRVGGGGDQGAVAGPRRKRGRNRGQGRNGNQDQFAQVEASVVC